MDVYRSEAQRIKAGWLQKIASEPIGAVAVHTGATGKPGLLPMAKKKTKRRVADHMAEKKTAPAVGPKPELLKVANDIRSLTTSMSDEKRESAFSFGMRLIYGGSGSVAAKTGRP